MSTRSITVLEDDQGAEIVVMYRHFDGYLAGYGAMLQKFLAPFTVHNGITGSQPESFANGAGCLAAQVVTYFKQNVAPRQIGGIYLYPAGTRDCGEEYIYTVRPVDGIVHMKVQDAYEKKTLYEGPARDFDPEAIEKAEQEAAAKDQG